MRFFSSDLLVAGLLVVSSVDARPANEVSTSQALEKRAWGYDEPSCKTKYGSMTAKQWVEKSWPGIRPLAKAGKDGLDKVVKVLEYQAGITEVEPTDIPEEEWERLSALYQVLFGEITKEGKETGEEDPTFNADAKAHIARIKKMTGGLQRLTTAARTNVKLHCDDKWLMDQHPKTKKAYDGKSVLKKGHKWLWNTDSNSWKQYLGGRPCQGQRAAVTFTGKQGQTVPESMTICPEYFKIQATLESKRQTPLWDLKPTLPAEYWNMKDNKVDKYHMAAFGRMMGMKLFHELMHTQAFYDTPRLYFDDMVLPNKQVAYGFDGAASLAKQDPVKAARNIDSLVYWCVAMHFPKYRWETGYAKLPEETPAEPETPAEGGSGSEKLPAEKRVPKGGKGGSGRPGGGSGGGSRPTKSNAPPPAPPTSKAPPPPPLTSQAPPPPPSSRQAPPKPSSSSQRPSSSVVSQASSTSGAPSSSKVSTTSQPTITSSATITNSASRSCSGTLCTSTATRSRSCSGTGTTCASSTQSGREETVTAKPEPVTAGDMTGSEKTALAAEVLAWEAAGGLALWNMALPGTMGTATDEPTEIASAGMSMHTGAAGNGTFTVRSVAPVQREVEVKTSWWKYIF